LKYLSFAYGDMDVGENHFGFCLIFLFI